MDKRGGLKGGEETALQGLNSNFPINHKDVQRDKARGDRLTDRVEKPRV